MAASALVISEMGEEAKPSDLWEDAYMKYEVKNFKDDSPYKGINTKFIATSWWH